VLRGLSSAAGSVMDHEISLPFTGKMRASVVEEKTEIRED
jgi:hypothetical protein